MLVQRPTDVVRPRPVKLVLRLALMVLLVVYNARVALVAPQDPFVRLFTKAVFVRLLVRVAVQLVAVVLGPQAAL